MSKLVEWFARFRQIALLEAQNDMLTKRNKVLEAEVVALTEQVHGLIDGAMINAGMQPLFAPPISVAPQPRDNIKNARTGRDFSHAATAQLLEDEVNRRLAG